LIPDISSLVMLSIFAVLSAIIGSIIGAGGGFIYTPLLILMGYTPRDAVSTSLVMVFFNSLSASYAYYKQRRINIRETIPLGIVTLPGAVVGAFILSSVDVRDFRIIFGVFLAAVSVYIIIKALQGKNEDEISVADGLYCRSIRRAYILSPLAGVLSSLFGVGGGILLVPTFIHIALIPTHIATATSQFITIFSSYFSLILLTATKPLLTIKIPVVAVSGIIGGQIGARISKRLKARMIKTIIAIVLIITAINIILEIKL